MTMVDTERWESMSELGFSAYEACPAGAVRSVDRMSGNRRLKGQPISTRVSNRGYVLLDLTEDSGKRVTRTLHTVLLGTFDGLPEPGQEARHLDDNPLNNCWAPGATKEERQAAGGNLMWGTPAENNEDKVANGNRNGPRPPKACVRCGHNVEGNGRRCHACIVWIGVEAARLLSAGTSLAAAMEELEYPSAEGLHRLAVAYGGYGLQPSEPEPVRHSLWRRAVVAVRDWLELGDSE